MSNKTYTSLHNHTDYSNLRLIDSINTVDKLIDRAYELGLSGVAITDHESISGHVQALEYYNKKYKDKQNEFKLILGNEIYITKEGLNAETHITGEVFNHFILLAKDAIGHKQLRELSTRAWRRSYMKNLVRTPTYWSDLEEVINQDPGHLVATTACLGGFPGFFVRQNMTEELDMFLEKASNLFGHDNFYIELQPYLFDTRYDFDRQKEQIKFNAHMIINYWDKYNFIYTTDSHYLKEEDREVHKWFLQSKSGEREVDEFYYYSYMMSYEEVNYFFKTYLSQEKFDIMTDNTQKINAMIEQYDLNYPQIVPKIEYNFEQFDSNMLHEMYTFFMENIDAQQHKYIYYFLNNENETDTYFMNLVMKGYHDKIYNFSSSVTIPERMDRLNYELEQIHETSLKINQSLSDYFITMAKIIEIIWDDADSLVGPGRGSASGFLINYLIGITQIDPQNQMLYLPPWRFIHQDRPELPDIDIDSESTKRTKIFNKIQTYFNSIGSEVINVCTFGTEGSKSSIRTAARALEIDDAVVSYLTSMIPNERGIDLTLTQCYEGDETHTPIKAFVEEMNKEPKLKKLAFAIEGLITRLGAHAAGILILSGNASDHNSIMKTSKGIVVSAFDLKDSEKMGGLKYDLLTVQALDKIHATMNYLLEDQKIEWQGSLRKTYDKYLLPANLEYKDPLMWKMLATGEIIDVFQFDTMVGSQAVKLIKPENIAELAIANSIMRLMAQEGMELPLDTFVKYKNDIKLWYHEMTIYGLIEPEIKILEPHLKLLYGVADSQESVMLLVMDKNITNFSLNEANLLRKAIAKKDFKTLEKTKELYFQKGQELGTSKHLLNYIWNVQIGRQIG